MPSAAQDRRKLAVVRLRSGRGSLRLGAQRLGLRLPSGRAHSAPARSHWQARLRRVYLAGGRAGRTARKGLPHPNMHAGGGTRRRSVPVASLPVKLTAGCSGARLRLRSSRLVSAHGAPVPAACAPFARCAHGRTCRLRGFAACARPLPASAGPSLRAALVAPLRRPRLSLRWARLSPGALSAALMSPSASRTRRRPPVRALRVRRRAPHASKATRKTSNGNSKSNSNSKSKSKSGQPTQTRAGSHARQGRFAPLRGGSSKRPSPDKHETCQLSGDGLAEAKAKAKTSRAHARPKKHRCPLFYGHLR
jgi:hypothetical protein